MGLATGLDFDGNVTDVEAGHEDYIPAYKGTLRAKLGIGEGDFKRIWELVKMDILGRPTEFGRRDPRTGHIVAPGTSDPSILTRTTAEELMLRLYERPQDLDFDMSPGLRERLPPDAEGRFRLLKEILDRHFHLIRTVFRPGLSDLLHGLKDIGKVAFVSDSKEQDIRKKLQFLRDQGERIPEIPIIGEARKYLLDPSWELGGIPTKLNCSPHLARKVFTQRRTFFEALHKGGVVEADSKLMAGDGWEVDLMLPFLLGMKGVLMRKKMTPGHELSIMEEQVRKGGARIANSLPEMLEAIRALHGV